MVRVVCFLVSTAGRVESALFGVALILIAFFVVGGVAGGFIAFLGVLPVLFAVLDICPLAPLAHYPLDGNAIRDHQ